MSRGTIVVWDVGQVLIEWHPEPFYDRVLGPERRAALFGAVDMYGMNLRVDAGAPWREEVAALAGRHPEWSDAVMLWHDRWIETLGPLIERSGRLMGALRAKGVPCWALSNFGRETWEVARASFPVLDRFDRAFVSGRLGLVKPDPAIYQAVEEAAAVEGVGPEGLLFADDRPENVEAAVRRGWRAHLFEGPEGWAAQLVAAGLLTNEEAA